MIDHYFNKKVVQESDIPTKLVKRFYNLTVNYLKKISITVLKEVPSLMTLKRLWLWPSIFTRPDMLHTFLKNRRPCFP